VAPEESNPFSRVIEMTDDDSDCWNTVVPDHLHTTLEKI
jgi:hypothetical protein